MLCVMKKFIVIDDSFIKLSQFGPIHKKSLTIDNIKTQTQHTNHKINDMN